MFFCDKPDNEAPVIMKAAISASCKVCCHLISKYYGWLVPAGAKLSLKVASSHVAVSSDNATEKFCQWMKQNYLACNERLLQLLCHCQPDVRWLALKSLMKLVHTEGSTHQNLSHTYMFPNTIFHEVVSNLLNSEEDMHCLISQFQEYLNYDDVRFYWLKDISSIVRTKVDKKSSKTVKVSEYFVTNIHHALKLVSMPASEKDISHFLIGIFEGTCFQTDGDVSDVEHGDEKKEDSKEERPPRRKKKKQEITIKSLHKHRKQFSDAWLAFLRLPLSPKLYKAVLTSLHSDVMPHLLDPRLLLDFLTDSYNAGGVVSLFALNGLFVLMHEYYLDYPDFYKKLYGLLEASIFHAKYMKRFFYLLDTFLQSTHLPLYLVAAFVKRIARLALTAPPSGVMVAVVFVINLLKRHPNCRVLLHRKHAEQHLSASGEDPYDMTQKDPACSNALDSSLWELRTLEAHFLPAVSKLVKRVLAPDTIFSDAEMDLSEYLDVDDDKVFNETCKMKYVASVPLNLIEPGSLWQPGELSDH